MGIASMEGDECLASVVHSPIQALPDRTARNQHQAGFFRSAQWTTDGTCLVTNSEDNSIRVYTLPEDLLTSPRQTLPLYNTLTHPEPINSLALYSHFDLTSPHRSLILTATRDHPLRLHNAHYHDLMASYPLIDEMTEAYISPHSLLFSTYGTHIIAGSKSLVSIFDLSRPGNGPIQSKRTIPSRRKKIVGGGVGIKGLVSSLGLSCDGTLAIGTFSRAVGLYSDEGRGDDIGVFSVEEAANGPSGDGIGGRGITQIEWSPNGSYLYVAERHSDGVLVFDVRVTGKMLTALRGRKAFTNQRLGIDVVATDEGHEIVAGGMDGVVRTWRNPHHTGGDQFPDHEFGAHQDAVGSAVMHPKHSILATCSGSRPREDENPQLPRPALGSDSEESGFRIPNIYPRIVPDGTSHGSRHSKTLDYTLKVWTTTCARENLLSTEDLNIYDTAYENAEEC